MASSSLAHAPFKMVLAAAGWAAVGLATAGVFIPGLPTTVFVLIAFYCFSRSSPRTARWLIEHRWLGPSLRLYLAGGGLPITAKRAALVAMWTSVLVSSAVLHHAHTRAGLGALALGVVGTLAIQFGVRTVPAHPVAAPPR
jgi:uncharacterized membrane protein YbaN (DUF454 family)